MALAWETVVQNEDYLYTERLKVFKGWIVRCRDSIKNTMSTCFVPDENYEWNLDKE